jgi:predicted metal-binding protein
MVEHKEFLIESIDRDFSVKGPVEVVCKPKGFNRWCTLPYPKHKNGCPNYGHRVTCPPQVGYFLDMFHPEVYLALLRFDFKEYLSEKKRLHPDWTERAIRNPFHFQTHLRAELSKSTEALLSKPEYQNYKCLYNAEGMGVNLHLTSRLVGVELEWPPKDNMYRIAILAKPLPLINQA